MQSDSDDEKRAAPRVRTRHRAHLATVVQMAIDNHKHVTKMPPQTGGVRRRDGAAEAPRDEQGTIAASADGDLGRASLAECSLLVVYAEPPTLLLTRTRRRAPQLSAKVRRARIGTAG